MNDEISSSPVSRSTLVPVAVGAALTCLAVADQTTLRWTSRDVTSHYGAFGVHPDPNVLTITLAVLSAAFLGASLLIRRQAARGHAGRAAAGAWCIALVWACFAVLASMAHEYGGHVFTASWRVLPWLMPLSAAAAGVALRATRRR